MTTMRMRSEVSFVRHILCGLATSAALMLAGTPAMAIDAWNGLVFACVSDGDAGDALVAEVSEDCDVELGRKSACQVLSGDPWVCNNNNGHQDADDLICEKTSTEITLNGEVHVGPPDPLGWTVAASLKANLTLSGTLKNRKTCGAVPQSPPYAGDAGSFVSDSATLRVLIDFQITGTLTISGPGGQSFSIDGTGSCDGEKEKKVYATTETIACAPPTTTEVRSIGEVDQTDPGKLGDGDHDQLEVDSSELRQ